MKGVFVGRLHILLFAGVAPLACSPALAADALDFGPAAAWVKPRAVPDTKQTAAPVALLLEDAQIFFEDGKTKTFSERAFRIQTAEGLAAGNISIQWQPATETVTVHKVHIRRGDKVIDVLANGQTFAVLRRETNLDAAMLDGTLTANIQPEGLQQGDIIDVATTIEHSDPVLKGHVGTTFAMWNGTPIELAHARLVWPSKTKVNVRQSALPSPSRSQRAGNVEVEFTAQKIEPLIPPKGTPKRFTVGRLAEASDFASWADVASLMMPLFREAAVIPPSGPLHDEVERIRESSSDPVKRAEEALSLVQDRVRYVALLMGAGGYVPASAESTWSRRFGDCKGKTALLLGALRSLGIDAEPVLVQSRLGDIIQDRLPNLAVFDHVLVRAHVGGKDYWLDGTRTGNSTLDGIQTPEFGWGLPVVADASLVRIVPSPLQRPVTDRKIDIDASAGVLTDAQIAISTTYRGDVAVLVNRIYTQASAQQKEEGLRADADNVFDHFAMSASSVQYDKAARELTIVQKGKAKLDWDDGWFSVPATSLGYNPDLHRVAGPLQDAPFATDYPNYEHRLVTIRLPQSFASQSHRLPQPVSEALLGVEYRRTAKLADNVLTVESSQRTIVPEVPYKDAIAAENRLRKLNDDDVYLRLPGGYAPSKADAVAMAEDKPGSAEEFVRRGNTYLNGAKYEEAIADFTQAIAMDAKNTYALADRAIAYARKQNFTAAEKDLTAVEASDPDSAVVLRARAILEESKGDCAKAIDFYTRSIARENHLFAVGHRAACEAHLGKNAEALTDSEQVLKKQPNWIEMRLVRANIFVVEGKTDLAMAEANTMIRDNPNSGYAWVAAAKIFAAGGRHEKAMKAIDRALAIKPEAYVYINRAQVRPASDVAGRMADIDTALKIDPTSEDALSLKAQLLNDKGDYKEALALLDRIKQVPKNGWAQQQRAIVLFKLGRISEAERLFRSARSAAVTATELNNLCWTKGTAGVMLESALQDCRESLKLDPDFGGSLDSLGMVLLKLGRLDEALDAYNRAIAKNTGAESLMGRAFVYLRKGDKPRAEADAAAARKMSAQIDERFASFGLEFGERSATVAGKAP